MKRALGVVVLLPVAFLLACPGHDTDQVPWPGISRALEAGVGPAGSGWNAPDLLRWAKCVRFLGYPAGVKGFDPSRLPNLPEDAHPEYRHASPGCTGSPRRWVEMRAFLVASGDGLHELLVRITRRTDRPLLGADSEALLYVRCDRSRCRLDSVEASWMH